MVFAGTAAFAAGASVAASVGVGAVTAAGLGLSAASAAGAFNGPVEKRLPTPGEIAAGKEAQAVYQIGRKIQTPLDRMAREDLQYLGSNAAMRNAGGLGVDQMWQRTGQLGQGLQQEAARSGGPGSGRFFGQLGQGAAIIDSGVRQANLQGRLGGLNEYIARQGQFLNRRTNDLQTGMATMSTGGAQAAQNQNARIQAQVNNNIATNQAMGQIGGSLMSVGMMGLGAAGKAGGAGGAPGYISPGPGGAIY